MHLAVIYLFIAPVIPMISANHGRSSCAACVGWQTQICTSCLGPGGGDGPYARERLAYCSAKLQVPSGTGRGAEGLCSQWGWGTSFHFSPRLPGKSIAASEAAHEARIAAVRISAMLGG